MHVRVDIYIYDLPLFIMLSENASTYPLLSCFFFFFFSLPLLISFKKKKSSYLHVYSSILVLASNNHSYLETVEEFFHTNTHKKLTCLSSARSFKRAKRVFLFRIWQGTPGVRGMCGGGGRTEGSFCDSVRSFGLTSGTMGVPTKAERKKPYDSDTTTTTERGSAYIVPWAQRSGWSLRLCLVFPWVLKQGCAVFGFAHIFHFLSALSAQRSEC